MRIFFLALKKTINFINYLHGKKIIFLSENYIFDKIYFNFVDRPNPKDITNVHVYVFPNEFLKLIKQNTPGSLENK